MARLSGSVGAGGRNKPDDVTVVQGALNGTWNGFDRDMKLETSGKYSRRLQDAIRIFQTFAVGARHPDGRIDAGRRTSQVLARKTELKRIVVSIELQEVYALLDGRCMMKLPCATGDANHPTEPGVFRIRRKEEQYTSKTYGSKMDFAMFFSSDGKAIHKYHGPTGHGIVSLRMVHFLKRHVSDSFGSHGCVRLEDSDAQRLFYWTPYNTEVHVY